MAEYTEEVDAARDYAHSPLRRYENEAMKTVNFKPLSNYIRRHKPHLNYFASIC